MTLRFHLTLVRLDIIKKTSRALVAMPTILATLGSRDQEDDGLRYPIFKITKQNEQKLWLKQ
jgi:hypothetical protein